MPPALRSSGPGCFNLRSRRGFTLIESVMALSIVTISGGVLLLSAQSSLDVVTGACDRTIAEGLADLLLDEIVSKRYMSSGGDPLDTTLGPSATEAAGIGRSLYNDVDDYNGLSNKPVAGVYGEELGQGNDAGGNRNPNFVVSSTFFDNWRQNVSVFYVDPANFTTKLANNSSSRGNYRCVEVTIEYVAPDGTATLLASRKRIVSYLPAP